MKKLLLLVALALIASPVAVGSPPPPSGTITADQPGDHVYGDQLTYSVMTSGLKGNQYPMVSVACSQDGNLVWLSLQAPDGVWVLGSGGSQLDLSRSSSCVATLYAYTWKGGQESVDELDSLSFVASP